MDANNNSFIRLFDLPGLMFTNPDAYTYNHLRRLMLDNNNAIIEKSPFHRSFISIHCMVHRIDQQRQQQKKSARTKNNYLADDNQ